MRLRALVTTRRISEPSRAHNQTDPLPAAESFVSLLSGQAGTSKRREGGPTSTTTTTSSGPEGQIKLANGKISIPVTSVVLPTRLVIDSVHFTPSVVTSRRGPVSVRVHVSDTRGFVVRGALVFARSTPLVTSTPPEQLTNQAGFVTLTTFPRATFPLKRGFHVQFFLRTRKEGESVLTGVSSRRLAQVATR